VRTGQQMFLGFLLFFVKVPLVHDHLL
jgi:hypothetical protein